MALIGKKITEFNGMAYYDEKFVPVKTEDLQGKWSVVVFYPADFSFVCPTELEDLAEHYEQFKAEGCEVYSVSTDTHFVHKAWHDTSNSIKKINYKMIGDPTGKISRDFGVYIENEGLAYRGSFVINPEGIIVAYEIHDLGIGREASELLRKLQAAKFVAEYGEVCPARWKPGKKTIKPSIDLVGKI